MTSGKMCDRVNRPTTTYGEGAVAVGKAEFWTVVLMMVQVIWRELRKFMVEAETIYGSENSSEMMRQYLWGTLQAHWVMNDLLQTQLFQNLEVDPKITLQRFEHRAPRVEISALKQRMEAQDNAINQMEKKFKQLRYIFDSLMEKENILGKK